MKTSSFPHRFAGIRILVMALAFWILVPLQAKDQGGASLAAVTGRPRTLSPAATLPFSMQDFVTFLSDDFQIHPSESESDYTRFIYTERQRDGRDLEIMRVLIRSLENHLQVAFSFKEFNVMHYVAEFMEGPFFTRSESEQLYALLYTPAGQGSWRTVGRFQARVTLVDASEGYEALFEFAASTNVGRH